VRARRNGLRQKLVGHPSGGLPLRYGAALCKLSVYGPAIRPNGLAASAFQYRSRVYHS
jgi:hypothetical protein